MAEVILLHVLFVVQRKKFVWQILSSFLFFFLSDLSENQIQAIPRKAFRGAVDIKNL